MVNPALRILDTGATAPVAVECFFCELTIDVGEPFAFVLVGDESDPRGSACHTCATSTVGVLRAMLYEQAERAEGLATELRALANSLREGQQP